LSLACTTYSAVTSWIRQSHPLLSSATFIRLPNASSVMHISLNACSFWKSVIHEWRWGWCCGQPSVISLNLCDLVLGEIVMIPYGWLILGKHRYLLFSSASPSHSRPAPNIRMFKILHHWLQLIGTVGQTIRNLSNVLLISPRGTKISARITCFYSFSFRSFGSMYWACRTSFWTIRYSDHPKWTKQHDMCTAGYTSSHALIR